MSSRSSSCTVGLVLAVAAIGHAGVGWPTGTDAVTGAGSATTRAGAGIDAAGAAGFVSAGGLETVGFVGDPVAKGAVVLGAAGLPGSLFRRSPRATRSVPFDCSIFMGLVRTRLAPIRNAFATPA